MEIDLVVDRGADMPLLDKLIEKLQSAAKNIPPIQAGKDLLVVVNGGTMGSDLIYHFLHLQRMK